MCNLIELTSIVTFRLGNCSDRDTSTSDSAFEDGRSRMWMYQAIFFSLFDDAERYTIFR